MSHTSLIASCQWHYASCNSDTQTSGQVIIKCSPFVIRQFDRAIIKIKILEVGLIKVANYDTHLEEG